MIFLASAHATQQSQTLGTFIFSVASGLTVLLLAFLVSTIRKFLGQHKWLIEQVNLHSVAIEELLEERRPARARAVAAKRAPPRTTRR